MSGQIILINGTSGSGKSTTCEMFAQQADDYWLLYGIDHFMSQTLPAKFGHHGPRSREGIHAGPVDATKPNGAQRWTFGPHGLRAFQILHEWMASVARLGGNVIFDHLLMTDPPVLQDCIWRLKDVPVLLVTLKPPFEVLERRIKERPIVPERMQNDILGENAHQKTVERLNRLRPWFYETVYANDISDLEIDTAAYGPAEVCAMIKERLKQGPGTAFERLRKKWPAQ